MLFHAAIRTAPTFRHVSLAEIDGEDETFVITYRPDTTSLQRSVEQLGVLTPVHLRQAEEGGKLQIICGSKRIQACRHAGQTSVPALIYRAEAVSEEAALQLAVHDNLGGRVLNAVEKGRILWRMHHRYQHAIAELATAMCPLLDLPPREDTVKDYCRLVTLDEALQNAMADATLPLETVLWIGQHEAADQQALLRLFTELRLGQNRVRELANLTREICHRDGCEVVSLWQELGIEAILSDCSLSGPQKVERIRGQFRTRRYPQLSAHQQQFQEALQQLRLPPQISWQPPPYFDGHQYQVNFRFGTHAELQAYAQRLLEAASKPALDRLLDLL